MRKPRALTGGLWGRVRRDVLKRDLWLCQPCKRAGHLEPATEVDHVRAIFLGGGDDMENLEAICGDCHKLKSTAERNAKPRKPPRLRMLRTRL